MSDGSRRPDPTPSDGPDPYGNPDPDWLEVNWFEHLRWVEAGDARVNVVELGAGDPILFVHGLSGCWRNWLENLLPFAERHRVVAVDLPGFGASPTPSWPLSAPCYGRFMHELVDELDLEGATLVGNSLGGFIAAETAIADPDWVDRLVLVSAAGISSRRLRAEPVEAFARMATALSPLALRVRERSLRRPQLRYAAFRSVFHRPLELRSELLWEQWNGGAGAPGFADALTELAGYDFVDRLEAITVPTMVVWGAQDRIVPPADAIEWHRRLPDARLEVFDECGHVPMAERPIRFNRLLAEFIESTPVG